jgi:hypothetical protein
VGNLGVAVIQLVGLLVLATAGHQASYWVCAVYLVLLGARVSNGSRGSGVTRRGSGFHSAAEGDESRYRGALGGDWTPWMQTRALSAGKRPGGSGRRQGGQSGYADVAVKFSEVVAGGQ